MIYEFSRAELDFIRQVANDRAIPKIEARLEHNLFGQYDNEVRQVIRNHAAGVASELAVARLLGGVIDTTSSLWGDKHTGDVIVDKSCRISVKFTRYYHRPEFKLSGTDSSEFRDDYGVLVVPVADNPRAMRLYGWCDRDTFVACATVHNYSYGERLILPGRYFKPMIMFPTLRKKTA